MPDRPVWIYGDGNPPLEHEPNAQCASGYEAPFIHE